MLLLSAPKAFKNHERKNKNKEEEEVDQQKRNVHNRDTEQ